MPMRTCGFGNPKYFLTKQEGRITTYELVDMVDGKPVFPKMYEVGHVPSNNSNQEDSKTQKED